MADQTGQERSELNRLQQEAIRRAREMQARAKISPARAAQNGAARPAPQKAGPPPPPPQPRPEDVPPSAAPQPRAEQTPSAAPQERAENAAAPRKQPAPSSPPSSPPESFFGGISGSLDFLLKDSERSMLLILLLILMEEKADTSLIFAMLYLLI